MWTIISTAALCAAICALLIGVYARQIGELTDLIDHPDKVGGRKRHKTATPIVGGIALFFASWIGLGAMWLVSGMPAPLLGIAVASTAMFLMGFVDDRSGLSAILRLLGGAVVLLLVMILVPDLTIHFLLFSGQSEFINLVGVWGTIFSLICLLGFQNAVNMADGKNGFILGQAMAWTLILGIRVPSFLPLLAPMAAALVVLMWFNMKDKLFLGDNGSYALSTFYGLLAILIWNDSFTNLRADDLALVFALPVFDTLRLIFQRMLKRRSPFTPGRDHLHHYLTMRWGWPKPLPYILLLVLIPNLGAILLPGTALWWLIASLFAYALVLYLCMRRRKIKVYIEKVL